MDRKTWEEAWRWARRRYIDGINDMTPDEYVCLTGPQCIAWNRICRRQHADELSHPLTTRKVVYDLVSEILDTP